MATDFRKRQIQMPVIPPSRTVRERLQEVMDQAEKLRILLRFAVELEQPKSKLELEDSNRE
jgi:sulfur transfer protein SufE